MSSLLSAHRPISILLVAFAVSLLGLPAQAQESGSISGTIFDAQNGQTLPGANVSIVGSQRGTATNADGEYTLENVQPGTYSLRASFVGFQPQVVEDVEVTSGEETQVNFELRASQETLEEVVVVGYGQQEEQDLTGSFSKIDSASFKKGSFASPEELIRGTVAGLQISSSTGAPGEKPLIRLRGGTSLNASNEPLFVIDGVPIDNESTSGGRNPLNFLNPSDIEEVSVLKDASATAIYGSRGANGVILIETKKGDADRESISYSGSFSTSRVADRPDMLSADEYRDLVAGELIEGVEFPATERRLGDASTDWFKEVTRDARVQDHSLSMAGGNEDRKYRLSLGYYQKEGIVQTSRTERVSAAVNYRELFLDDQFILNANVRATRTEDQFSPGGTVGNATFFDPTQPVKDPESEFGGFFEWAPGSLAPNNPVAEYTLVDNEGNQYRSLGNFKFEYNVPVVEGLTLRLNLGYDVNSGENEFFSPSIRRAEQGTDEPGTLARRTFTRVNLLSDAYLEYSNRFDAIESQIDFTAGYSYQDFNEEYPELEAEGLSTDLLRQYSTGPASIQRGIINEIDNRLISGFGRLNYSFKGRYIATLTVRRDGSSRFGPRNRWGTFPSAALAWRVSDEPFLEDITFLSDLKIRGSWGITGNQEIGDFQYVSTFGFSDELARVQFGNRFLSMLRPSGADPSLKWEETTQYNVGVNFGILANRFTGSVEYYRKETDDLIFDAVAPAGTNVTDVVTTNIGALQNQGVEVSLDGALLDGRNLSWDVSFTASTNDNVVQKIDRDSEGASQIRTGSIAGGTGQQVQLLREGEPAYSFWLYEHKMNENGDPVTDLGEDVSPTDLYKDQDGDGDIDAQDRVLMGNPFPDWTFGHTSRFRYSDLDFSFSLRAQVGNDVYNNTASNAGNISGVATNDGIPQNRHASVLEYRFRDKQILSDVYLEDGSFLKVDNVTLGYTVTAIPAVKRLRVFGRVEDAFVLTGYSGPQPEIAFGIDNNVFPRSRTFTAGINLEF